MQRILAVAVILAALWSLYGNCMLAFIVWYSGVDPEMTASDWFGLALQATVNVCAIVLVWRSVRKRAGATDR
ncbi:MAG: hypothetical protein ACI9S9_001364 [Planctomycetota bacterium]|jgi:hypothetical protein